MSASSGGGLASDWLKRRTLRASQENALCLTRHLQHQQESKLSQKRSTKWNWRRESENTLQCESISAAWRRSSLARSENSPPILISPLKQGTLTTRKDRVKHSRLRPSPTRISRNGVNGFQASLVVISTSRNRPTAPSRRFASS